MTENDAIKKIQYRIDTASEIAGKGEDGKAFEDLEMAIQAIEEIQQYRAIENELKEKYGANVGIKDLIHYFIDTIFKGEKHEGFCILTNEDAKMWDEYRAIGTVEDIQKKLAELDRWHTDTINNKIKNSFANTSTLICHNCDHKDDYIEYLEAEINEYRSIGTIEECREAVERMKPKKVTIRVNDKDARFGNVVFLKGAKTYACQCGSWTTPIHKYCYECGQKFLWEE